VGTGVEAILPFGAGEAGFRFEEARRNCGVVPLAVLRLETDLLADRAGEDCLSPRLELAAEGDREGELGEDDFVLFLAGVR
jgi:hypothetical protein